jgi:hypothetical protein
VSYGRRLLLAAALVFVVPLAGYLMAGKPNSPSARPQVGQVTWDTSPRVFVIASREDAEGLTQADMTPEALTRFEAVTLERFKKHMAAVLARRGKAFNADQMTAESVYAEIGHKKLAVTKLKVQGITLAVQFLGIVGPELVRVGCVTDQPSDVVVAAAPCNDKIRETFGVSLNPLEHSNG